MITPTPLSNEQLEIARLAKIGDKIIPSPELIKLYNPKSVDLTIVNIRNDLNHSDSNLSFSVSGDTKLKFCHFDASWFMWPILIDPRFTDPSQISR